MNRNDAGSLSKAVAQRGQTHRTGTVHMMKRAFLDLEGRGVATTNKVCN